MQKDASKISQETQINFSNTSYSKKVLKQNTPQNRSQQMNLKKFRSRKKRKVVLKQEILHKPEADVLSVCLSYTTIRKETFFLGTLTFGRESPGQKAGAFLTSNTIIGHRSAIGHRKKKKHVFFPQTLSMYV